MANTLASVLITECLDNLARASTGTTRSGATLESKALEWLNKTEMDISKRHDFREMKKRYQMSTADGIKSYNFPTSYKNICSMKLFETTNPYNSRKLKLWLPQSTDKKVPYPEGDTENIPLVYAPYGNVFDLLPIPDRVFTIEARVILYPTKITDVSSSVNYEPNKDELIVSGMTYRGFMYLQSYDDAKAWKNDYRDFFNSAVDLDIDEPDYSPVGEGFDGYSSNVDSVSRSGVYPTETYWANPLLVR